MDNTITKKRTSTKKRTVNRSKSKKRSSTKTKKRSSTKTKKRSSTNNSYPLYVTNKRISKRNKSAPILNYKNTLEYQTEKPISYKPLHTNVSIKHRGYKEVNMFDNDKPIMIFNIGAVGAGKSKLFRYVKQLLYEIEENDVIKFNEYSIDNYIQTSNDYKIEVDKILDKYNLKGYRLKPKYIDKMDVATKQKLIEDMTNAYFTIKDVGPCRYNNVNSKDSCRYKMMKDIKSDIMNKKDIIIEINGKEIPHKYIDLDKENEYNIVFTYSLVHFGKLKTRIYNRFIRELNDYDMDKYNKKAPRLPNYSDDFLTSHIDDIMKTLILIRNFCLLRDPKRKDEKEEQKKVCKKITGKGSSRINLLIFSNNNENHARDLVYDHKKFDKYISEQQFTDLIRKYIYV